MYSQAKSTPAGPPLPVQERLSAPCQSVSQSAKRRVANMLLLPSPSIFAPSAPPRMCRRMATAVLSSVSPKPLLRRIRVRRSIVNPQPDRELQVHSRDSGWSRASISLRPAAVASQGSAPVRWIHVEAKRRAIIVCPRGGRSCSAAGWNA